MAKHDDAARPAIAPHKYIVLRPAGFSNLSQCAFRAHRSLCSQTIRVLFKCISVSGVTACSIGAFITLLIRCISLFLLFSFIALVTTSSVPISSPCFFRAQSEWSPTIRQLSKGKACLSHVGQMCSPRIWISRVPGLRLTI
jgi:hypothetical protein